MCEGSTESSLTLFVFDSDPPIVTLVYLVHCSVSILYGPCNCYR